MLSKKDVLANRSISATDITAPFGSGVQPMSPGMLGGTLTAGPQPNVTTPPNSANDSLIELRCPQCAFVATTWNDFREHTREKHNVRDAELSNRDDIIQTYAALFVDSIGSTLPFKARFSFHDVDTFCRREGIFSFVNGPLSADFYRQLSDAIHRLTMGHVTITPSYTNTDSDQAMHPLSLIDLQACRPNEPDQEPVRSSSPIKLYANVKLKSGEIVDVVDIDGHRYTGVDDRFVTHQFDIGDVEAYANIDDVIVVHGTETTKRCALCGHKLVAHSAVHHSCSYCGEGVS